MDRPTTFHLDENRVALPKGTRVVLRTDLRADDDYLCKAGTVATVSEAAYNRYTVTTPAGHVVSCQRDQLALQRHDQLPALARRQEDFAALQRHVIFSAVVGSVAWGLADEGSDEDKKGVFLLPFDTWAGLWRPPDEIADPLRDVQYWEVQKLVYQGLRGDANTLELLWSPHIRVCTELGVSLLEQRRMFVSQNVFGTFGRYAMSQFRKMRAADRRGDVRRAIVDALGKQPDLPHDALLDELCRADLFEGRHARRRADDAVKDLYRSLFDRGLLNERGYEPLCRLLQQGDQDEAVARVLREPPRWKNAYNLLRLLHSGIRWLTEGEPLIRVEGELRDRLLSVKRGEAPLPEVLSEADRLAEQLEAAFALTSLPEEPDYEAAHKFLLCCRRNAASRALAHLPPPEVGQHRRPACAGITVGLDVSPPELAPARFDVPMDRLRDFLTRYQGLDIVVCGLVGSHSYGFPSQDSDFDLKAIHLARTDELLGLDAPRPTINFLDVVDGLEIDFTSHEAKDAIGRMLRGDGNVLERILSPYLVWPTAANDRLMELRHLAQANLSKKYFRHYAGFFRGQIHQYQKEQSKKIKTLLYMFRVALTGVHLLREQRLLPDLKLLLELYPFPEVSELFELKEKAELAKVDDDEPYLALLPRLQQMLDEAHDASPLPDEPTYRKELNRWLLRARQG